MPYVELKTNREISSKMIRTFRDAIGETICVIPSKSYEVTMIRLEDKCCMTKGREEVPCAFMDVRLYTATTKEAKVEFSKRMGEILKRELGIDEKCLYINFLEMNGWGSGLGYNEAEK